MEDIFPGQLTSHVLIHFLKIEKKKSSLGSANSDQHFKLIEL